MAELTYAELTQGRESTRLSHMHKLTLSGSAVITYDMTTGTGYCLVGFNWIIDFLN